MLKYRESDQGPSTVVGSSQHLPGFILIVLYCSEFTRADSSSISKLLASGHGAVTSPRFACGWSQSRKLPPTVRQLLAICRTCDGPSLRIADLRALLNDYKREVAADARASSQDSSRTLGTGAESEAIIQRTKSHRFYHVASVRDVKLEDLPALLQEYRGLNDRTQAEVV